jgi:mono/diheme cytochrome c family protein
MLIKILPIGLLIGAALSPVTAWAQAAPVFRSVTVDLPAGDRVFPGGAAADAINNNCLACHSAGMVLNQPALPKAQWDAEVIKMHTAYSAPIDPKDVDAILDYLVSIKSVK